MINMQINGNFSTYITEKSNDNIIIYYRNPPFAGHQRKFSTINNEVTPQCGRQAKLQISFLFLSIILR